MIPLPFILLFWVQLYTLLLCFLSREDPLAFVGELVWWCCILSAVILMGIPLCVICCFSLAAFNICSLCLVFINLITMCLGVFCLGFILFECFPGGSEGKVSACNAGDTGSIPGLGRSPGEGKGHPLQYSGLKNAMD